MNAPERGKVLVVDDSPVDLAVLCQILKAEYSVRGVTDTGTAFDILHSAEKPDLIVLDIMMPGVDGLDFCRQIHADPFTGKIPVIFVTAKDTDEDEFAGFAAGGVDYVVKPVNPKLLRARVKTHVELKLVRENLEAQKRRLEAVNKELEAFTYSVSHDLRAPLRHISGFSDLLSQKVEKTLDEESVRLMTRITDAAAKMGTLIEDLLMFSRMGRVAMRMETLDLETMVREAIESLSQERAQRTIQWEVGQLPAVRADPAMIKLVLQNLIENALKFTRPRERAVIHVAGTASEAEAVISIRDNGVGFDMRYADKLFGVFQRLHRAEEFEGTGIGLANVRRIIQRHGGRTWAEAEAGKGAVFYFSLPLRAPTREGTSIE